MQSLIQAFGSFFGVNFCQRVHQELQKLQASVTVKKSADLSHTFRITKTAEGALVSVNEHTIRSKIGGFKKVKTGKDLHLPALEVLPFVRLRAKLEEWDPAALEGFETHTYIYEALLALGLAENIAEPPTRVHGGEYKQKFYPFTLAHSEYPAKLTLSERLFICAKLLRAVSAIHSLGYTHGDVRNTNILLNEAKKCFLNDFDNARANLHGVKADFFPRDIATQAGLQNLYADIVGCAISLFHGVFKGGALLLRFGDDPHHGCLKGPGVYESLCGRLIEPDDCNKEVLKEALGIILEVIQAEDAVFSLLVSAMHDHMNKRAKKAGFTDNLVEMGIKLYTIERFCRIEELTKSDACPTLNNINTVLAFLHQKQIDKNYIPKTCDERAIGSFYESASSDVQYMLRNIQYDYESMHALKDKPVGSKVSDESLFLQLISEDVQERLQGFSKIAGITPNPLDLAARLEALSRK